ncbi:MAG: hypothetical protein KY445_14090, partial [Armatimonadetes bacterium]|nr:hypothetical protein [Armatimonadota bacterium]
PRTRQNLSSSLRHLTTTQFSLEGVLMRKRVGCLSCILICLIGVYYAQLRFLESMAGMALDSCFRSMASSGCCQKSLPLSIVASHAGDCHQLRFKNGVPVDIWGTNIRFRQDISGRKKLSSAGPNKIWGDFDDVEFRW